jgi:hypothetical protein
MKKYILGLYNAIICELPRNHLVAQVGEKKCSCQHCLLRFRLIVALTNQEFIHITHQPTVILSASYHIK